MNKPPLFKLSKRKSSHTITQRALFRSRSKVHSLIPSPKPVHSLSRFSNLSQNRKPVRSLTFQSASLSHSSLFHLQRRLFHSSPSQFTNFEEFSDIDDLYGDVSTPPSVQRLVSSSQLAPSHSQSHLTLDRNSHQSQSSASLDSTVNQVDDEPTQSSTASKTMTIYNVISGINPNPVGVTVFRLSGPYSYHALSLLARTPINILRKRAEKRVFTATLYEIPELHPQLQLHQLVRDNNVELSLDLSQTEQLQQNNSINSHLIAHIQENNQNQQTQPNNEEHDQQKVQQNKPHPTELDFGHFDSFNTNSNSTKIQRSRIDLQIPSSNWSNESLFNTIPPQLHNHHVNHNNTNSHSNSNSNSNVVASTLPVSTNMTQISDDIIDLEAMIVAFQGPKSFTGEDTIELHVHGNPIIVKQLFTQLNKLNATRVAKNGEFIQRAYLNNRLTLLQVESYYDLLHSKNTTELTHAARSAQMNKDIQHVYNKWRHVLIESLAYLESIIDFGEDEGDIDQEEILKYVYPQVNAIRNDLYTLLQRKTRENVSNGISVSIFGAPNVGKSSLLNKIIGRQMAIVSAIPGTTRDIVSTSLDIDGLPVQIHDTAGIRDTNDIVEWEGIRRATELSKDIDYKVVLFDATPLSTLINTILESKHGISSYQQFVEAQNKYKATNNNADLSAAASVNSPPTDSNNVPNTAQFNTKDTSNTLQLTPIDQDIIQIITQALHAQHHSIRSLLSTQTLLIWTKCDTLPFTTFTSLNTMSSQPTSDPIYLQKQTVRRETVNQQNNDEIHQDILRLNQLLKNNQQQQQQQQQQQEYNNNLLIDPNHNPNYSSNSNEYIDTNAVFDDLSSQIMSTKSLSYNQNSLHQINNSPNIANNPNTSSTNHTNLNKLLKEIPLAPYLSTITKIALLTPSFSSSTTPSLSSQLTSLPTKSSLYHDIICVSSRYDYNIPGVSSAIHSYAKQTASSLSHLSFPNKHNDITMNPTTQPSKLGSASTNKSNSDYINQISLSNLFIKHDITLSSRHRQSLLYCYDELTIFLTQLHTTTLNIDNQLNKTDPAQPTSLIQTTAKPVVNHVNVVDNFNKNELVKNKNAKRAMPKRDGDLVLSAASLRNAVNAIAEIDGQGEVHAEEVLDALFNRFCIGK